MVEEEELRQASKGDSKAHEEPGSSMVVKEAGTSSKGDGKAQEKPAAEDVKTVPFYKLFAFADSLDVVLMLVGTVGAIGNGLTLPLMTIIFGQLTNAFGNNATNKNEVVDQVSKVAVKFVYLGCGSAVAALLEVACWMCTGERQAARIRSLYLKAILRQDITFFDKETNTGEVIERMSGDTILIQDAMGEKVGKFIQLTTTFVGGFIIAFIKGWKLTLVLLAVVPMIAIAGGVMAMLISTMASKGQTAYAEAGTVVEQAIGAIRTVASFTGEKKAVADYDRALNKAYKAGVFQGVVTGCGLGFLLFSVFSSYSLAMWFGSKLILHDDYTGGSVINVIFAVLTGGMSLGQASPSVSAFAAGKAAAYKMFEVIHRTPEIDVFDKTGITPDDIKGDVELRNVTFAYPARPDVPIFSNFCLTIPSGITAALVGESGSGKSTVISLIERFYDPQGGEVLVDGVDIRKYQLKWLRQHIGLVSQEPVLFGTSIRENISYGRDGASEEEIKEAARLANALKFIEKMPQGFETHVGEHGTQLSGGQKQRVAIARAILKNPTILLLDEATSALDAQSERLVQQALDGIMQNRTTIIVAHRLSTIKNADNISVVQRGNIVETGTHSELLRRSDGAYAQLVRLQEVHQEKLDKAVAMAYADPDDITPVLDNNELSRTSSNNRSSFGSRRISRTSFSLGRSLSLKGSVQDVEEGGGGEEMPKSKSSFFRLASLNKPETPIFILGMFGAAGHGVLFPVFGLLLSSVIGTFFETNRHKLRTDANFWSSMFLVIAVSCIFILPLQMGSFALAGQRLIRRVRRMCFDAVVRQEIAWFDAADNSSGAISARLSGDAAHVRSMVGESLSVTVQSLVTIVAGLIIAFTGNWILALMILALVPLLSIQGFVQTKLMMGFSKDAKAMYEEATKIATDAVSSIRTVASYCMEQKMLQLYQRKCDLPLKNGVHTGIVSGLGLGFSNFVLYGTYALSFWYGARLVKEDKTTFKKVFRVFFAITMSALGVSQTVSLAPDFVKVKKAANSICTILDRKSKIDPSDTSGEKLDSITGNIEFRHVSFRYPSRPDARIFRDLSFTIEAGKTMALVGESGSGKSTVIALLERFYDPEAGHIFLDGMDIKQLQLKWLRQNMGLVSQEPILFNGTIRSNIAYGKDEGTVTQQEIEEAVAAANATRFIAALPNGYDTEVGERGIQLSGGQKQRIAIARAVVKNPRILLLDEATSALDAESERVVQEALDKVMVGRTTVVVAHRLSTIVNVDVIAVVKNGAIVEQGSHSELIGIPGGAYASLVKLHSSVPAK